MSDCAPVSTDPASAVMLSELLAGITELPESDDCLVHGVQLDSRRLDRDHIFIALQGDTVHGLNFLDAAIDKKVVAVLVESADERCGAKEKQTLAKASIMLVEIDDLYARAGEIVSRFFANPSAGLQLVGVTGTDGKTSVCHLVSQALNVNSNNCGVLGTLGWGVGDRLKSTGLTTPDAVVIQSALAEMRDSGARSVAMEVSSHALDQHRVSGIAFDVAVLTNIGRDHLDYHGNMQSYREAKQALFYMPQLRSAVINADDEFGALLIERLPQVDVYSFGSDARAGKHIQYKNVQHLSSGLSFELDYAESQYSVNSGLLGGFNVQNIAATFAVLVALGVSPELAADSLSGLKPVPGRMEATSLRNGAVAIVDYAHNPHALESVLDTVATHCDGQLLLVFGCGGDRDQGKRPMMAGIAERFCDLCVVTDDNPRTESGDTIVNQILEGFSSQDKVIVERDRKTAIELAMGKAGHGDFVVVAGKGHEDYQLVGEQRLQFSDSAVVAEFAGAMA